jgi:nucleotide-binding universal stress UspA family protein
MPSGEGDANVSTKLLVPLDGSELAQVAVGYAEQVATTLGWGVVLFGAVTNDSEHHLYLPATPVIEAPQDVWDRLEGRLGANAEAVRHEMAAAVDGMAAAADHLQAAGLHVEREVGIGNPTDLIARRAAAGDIAMIVMASHGHTGLARLFRGSVANGVVARSNRAVLIVRPFRDPEHRLDFEHADRLVPEQAEAVRNAMYAVAS